jgi:hypothetical protein
MSESEEQPRTLEVVTQELGKAHADTKDGEARLKKRRLEFFSLAQEAVASKTLARRTVSVAEFDSEDEAKVWLERHYPTFRLIEFDLREDDIVAILEEDPEKQPFVFVNPVDKKVYRKQVVGGSPMLDDDALKEEDPELWERITFVPEPERRLKAQDELEAEDLAKMQKYMYPGPPTIKLAAPRKAKDQEIETGTVDE